MANVMGIGAGLVGSKNEDVEISLPAKPVLDLNGEAPARPPARGRPWQRTFRRADGGACKIKKRLSLLRPNACLNVSLTRENWVSGGGACQIKKLTQHP